MPHAIIRAENGRRHEVDCGDVHLFSEATVATRDVARIPVLVLDVLSNCGTPVPGSRLVSAREDPR